MPLMPRSAAARCRHDRGAGGGRWRRWYRSQPLAAVILTAAAGLVILFLPGGRLTVLLLPGLAGTSGFLFGCALCALAAFLWFAPGHREFTGVAVILVSLTSLVTTNIGGFLVGTLLGVLGGSLGFAWHGTDDRPPSEAEPATRRGTG